MRHVRNRTLGH
jgi:hypothetical protein